MTFVLRGVFAKQAAEDLSERASTSDALGYPSVANFEEPDTPERWCVEIYLNDDFDETILVNELGEQANELSATSLPDNIDWVREGLKDLNPVAVGRFFIHGAHDADQVCPFHHAIQIDANQAFGTGHHGTTAGCLEAISKVTKRHKFKNILDLGTGSGVLAIALAKETKQEILATDIDPLSVQIAHENMQLNKVANHITCKQAAGFQHPVFREYGPFGLVVANILAGPLRKLAHPMTMHLESNATIILSGLLIRQQASVLSAYLEQGAFLVEAIHRDGWATLILNRS